MIMMMIIMIMIIIMMIQLIASFLMNISRSCLSIYWNLWHPAPMWSIMMLKVRVSWFVPQFFHYDINVNRNAVEIREKKLVHCVQGKYFKKMAKNLLFWTIIATIAKNLDDEVVVSNLIDNNFFQNFVDLIWSYKQGKFSIAIEYCFLSIY